MAAPSVSGGITVLENCGSAPSAPLASSTVVVATSLGTQFNNGINGTANGNFGNSGDNKSGALMGGVYALSGSTDLSVANRLGFFHFTTHDRVSNLSSTTGLMLIANSSSLGTEEAVWAVNGDKSTDYKCAVVNFNRSADAKTYTGSFDPADVTHMGIGATFDSTYATCNVDTFGYVDPYLVIDGVTGDKGDFSYVTDDINTNNSIINESPTGNIHHIFFSWGVGDGSTATDFLETLKVWEFSRQVAFTAWGRAHINDNDIGFETNASSSDVISFELCNWISNDPFYWNSIGSTSATVSYTSCVIQNAGDLTIVNGHTFDGCLFDGCAEIAATAPTLTNTTLKNASGAALSVGAAGAANMTGVTFSDNQTALKVDVAGSTTLDVTEITFDSSNTYYIEYTGTGTLTVTSPTSIASGKLNASGGGTITVVSPTADLTVNSSESASQINVFTTTTQTIIDTEASASQLVYTHSNETVDITVLKDGFSPYRQTGLVLSGNTTIDVQLVASREYDSSHGLTYTTDASWASNQLTVPTWGVTGQGVFSLIMEAFKSETALRNTAFNLQMDGAGSLYLVDDAEGATDGDIENLIECGVTYLDTSGTTTASWSGIKSVGTATGFTGEFQQVDGSGTTDARTTGIFNEVVKTYGDVTHGNFDYTDHLVLKYQPNGYRETRVDVLDSYGISALSPTLYIVAMQPVTIAAATGDPALTLTITDHGASPVTWNSKDFSITVTADAADSGEDVLRELNYNLSLDATYNGKDPFNWPEMVLEAGTAYETLQGITEGGAGAALKGVRVIDGSGNPHPDFTRMQADDGTYYTVPVTANISISNLPDDVGGDTHLQIYNVTTATLIYSGDPAGTSYSDSYTNGDAAYASSGDDVRIRFAHTNAGTTFELGQTTVTATTDGITANGDNFIAADSVYATNGIDGSTITKFSYTPVNDQFNLIISSNFTAAEMYAFYCYTLTTTDGIEGAYGAFEASDAGNYKNITAITSIYLDNETTASKRQTDTARIYRDDGAYPVLDPTTSGFGIDINWQNVVYVVTAGSGLTAPQAAELTTAASVKTDTNQLTFTKTNELDINVQSVNGTSIAGSGTELDPWGP